MKAGVLPCRRKQPGKVGPWRGSGLQVRPPACGHVLGGGRPACAADKRVPQELVGRCVLLQGASTCTSGSAHLQVESAVPHGMQDKAWVASVRCRAAAWSDAPLLAPAAAQLSESRVHLLCRPITVPPQLHCATGSLLSRCQHLAGSKGVLTRALLQGEEEEAAPEKPAKKAVREEDVFAGNKNLRSEDVKFREIHDDR